MYQFFQKYKKKSLILTRRENLKNRAGLLDNSGYLNSCIAADDDHNWSFQNKEISSCAYFEQASYTRGLTVMEIELMLLKKY